MSKLTIGFSKPGEDVFRNILRGSHFKSFIFEKGELTMYRESEREGNPFTRHDFKKGHEHRIRFARIRKILNTITREPLEGAGDSVIKYDL